MQTYAPYLVHVAAVFTLCCYLFRDQIRLRIFAAVGDALLIAYYYFAFDVPLWNPMVWSALNVIINTAMILILLRDQRQLAMTDAELSLFRALDTLSPGQFRKLVAKGAWHKAEEPVALAREGETLGELHYVLDGKVTVAKGGRQFPVEPRLFIGEVAFLRKRAATATVTVSDNGSYISWPHAELEVLLAKNEDLKHALTRLLGQDLAEKMANS